MIAGAGFIWQHAERCTRPGPRWPVAGASDAPRRRRHDKHAPARDHRRRSHAPAQRQVPARLREWTFAPSPLDVYPRLGLQTKVIETTQTEPDKPGESL